MKRLLSSPEVIAAAITVVGTFLVSMILSYLEGRVGFTTVVTILAAIFLVLLLIVLCMRAGPRVSAGATAVMVVAGFLLFLAFGRGRQSIESPVTPVAGGVTTITPAMLGEASPATATQERTATIASSPFPTTSSTPTVPPPGEPSATEVGRVPTTTVQGGRLLFSSNGDIYVVNADGSGEINLTNSPDNDYGPSWSPDGTKIAFWTNIDGNYEVYVINVDGSGLTNLTNNSSDDKYPVWSPDGTKIAFWSSRGSGGVYIMSTDGSQQALVSSRMSHDYRPAWSNDSRKIAYANVYAEGLIRIANIDGLGEYVLLQGDVNYDLRGGPHYEWSPTRPNIAALLNTDGKDDLYVVNTDSLETIRLTDDSTTEGAITWSPDGQYIAFAKMGNVFIMEADGSGQPVNLTNEPKNSGSYRTLSWSPDGSQIAYTDSGGNGIHLIKTDGSGQSRLTSRHWDNFYDWGPLWQPNSDPSE